MAKRKRETGGDPCPCGAGPGYDTCCGRLHRGESTATSAEQLMRSRYSAFARGDARYLLESWHPSTRPAELDLGDGQRWLRLDIVDASGGSLFEAAGEVEFKAHYREGGRTGTVHERSRFVREDGRWLYVAEV
ncbi:YchJ family protein [Catenuloplanes sp. NPDC051500]|uniref:YchJ family protein n=1 Tax=Catenuloplanes sp. NPDC051500 TaxID=3363959 RepID=UPI0037A66F71